MKKEDYTIDYNHNNKENVDWSCISKYQSLSESFMRDFQDNVDWNGIFKYLKHQPLSESFKRNFTE